VERLALGSRGGSRIPTAVAQVLLNLIVDGDPLQAAVDRPRLHHQWRPDEIGAEMGALSPESAAELQRRGHQISTIHNVGEVNAVRVLADGVEEAAADRRGPSAAGVAVPAGVGSAASTKRTRTGS